MSRSCVLTLMCMLGLAPPARAQKATLEGVVNVNTASPEELRLLTGIGPARIRNILAYRHKHPFRTVENWRASKASVARWCGTCAFTWR